MHAATYSGHPVCCAVALRNLDIIEDEGLVERAAAMGARLLEGLETLRDLPAVGDVRGLGMMCGVELVRDRANKAPLVGVAARLTEEALARGLLIRMRAGAGDPAIGDTITLAPPLMTPTDVLDRIPEILRQAIKAAAG
jgi:adenosylmethionine-8-amino-7-oxononanoate aminotransferase